MSGERAQADSARRPVLDAEPGDRPKRPVVGHEDHVVFRRMSRNHQIERAERPSAPIKLRAKGPVTPRGRAGPGQYVDGGEKPVNGDAKLCGFRPFGDAEKKFGLRHQGQADAVGRRRGTGRRWR